MKARLDSHFNQVQMNAQNLLLMRLFQVTLGLLLFAIVGQAQTQVYGTVLDAETGEPLIGASVYLEEYRDIAGLDFLRRAGVEVKKISLDSI